MDKRQKICIVIIALTIVIATIAYMAVNNNENKESNKTSSNVSNELKESGSNSEEILPDESLNEAEKSDNSDNNASNEEETTIPESNNSYIGEEEKTEEETEEAGMSDKEIEEKAIQLVKDEWGTESKVYFKLENKNENKYYISVRDESTSNANAWYVVDITNWTVEEY
jgi:hypothetical protein